MTRHPHIAIHITPDAADYRVGLDTLLGMSAVYVEGAALE